jgi:hypothetical protein
VDSFVGQTVRSRSTGQASKESQFARGPKRSMRLTAGYGRTFR